MATSTIRPHPPPTARNRRPPLTLDLLNARAVAIVLGQGDDYTRFRFAMDQAGERPASLRDLARRLTVHPSSLSRSNFTLTAARRRQAAAILGVPAGFLARDWRPPRDLPPILAPLHAAMEQLRQTLNADGLMLSDGWIHEARLAGLTRAVAQNALQEQPTGVVTRLTHLCQEIGRSRLDRRFDLHLTGGDWLQIIIALVDQALHSDAGDLQHPALVLAKRLVRQCDDQERP
jgi:hypothetical protein